MAVDATMLLTRPGRRDAYLDWLQMLTGALLILFMWCHMILVSSVIISPRIMDGIAWFFEATYMAQLGGPAIFLVFLVHFILAARKMPFTATDQQNIWRHAKLLKHRETWLWLVQAGTAMIILVMGGIHMWVVLNDLPITAAKSASRVASHGWTIFYLILLPVAELHVSIGFYRIGVKWGIISAAARPKAKRAECVIFSVFMLIGLLTIIRFVTLA
ncbi:MAG: succinate dehydrogenase/fumarate reductase cytochrome b subunit [Desulfovibrionaceae bacterium]|nr:succinate dehydrogenase/fumarate reductase cytochrome b subunit [Desulfovibrionaceae bacterium]